jgi:hypothetical protein
MQKRDQTGKGDTGRREASLLNEHAWAEIARTLGITRRELQIVQGVFDNLPEAGTVYKGPAATICSQTKAIKETIELCPNSNAHSAKTKPRRSP